MVQTSDANLSQCMRLLNGVSTDPDIQEFEMQFYISGKWQNTEESMPVNSPFDDSFVDEVSIAGPEEVEKAIVSIVSAQRGALVMEEMPYWRRSDIIAKAACRFCLQIYNG